MTDVERINSCLTSVFFYGLGLSADSGCWLAFYLIIVYIYNIFNLRGS